MAEEVLPKAKVVVNPFHVIADSNRRMDEVGKIEQDVLRKRKVQNTEEAIFGRWGEAE